MQRCKNRHIKNEQKKQKTIANQTLHHTTQRCICIYGFVANPTLSIQKNFNNALEKGMLHNTGQPTT
jgi:hypothetical protein